MRSDRLRDQHVLSTWALSLLTFMACALFVIVVGIRTGVAAAVYLPMAVAIGGVLAGIPVAYRIPAGDDEDDDDEAVDRGGAAT